MVDAVVLAGGTDRGELAAETGIAHRPLLEVNGRPIIQRVTGALRGAAEVDRVVLVAPELVQSAVDEAAVDVRVPAGELFVENLSNGVAAASPTVDFVLLLTGDLPLITPAALNDLAQQAERVRADVAYAVIPKESCERAFPGGRRTYVRLREGIYTGGNGVVAGRTFVSEHQDLVERLFAARKNPIKLARMFGLGVVLGLATGRLALPQLEARAGQMIGGRVAALISTYPELAFDVDKVHDLNIARQVAESFERQ